MIVLLRLSTSLGLPNVWSDGSLVVCEITEVLSGGSVVVAPLSGLSWFTRRYCHLAVVELDEDFGAGSCRLYWSVQGLSRLSNAVTSGFLFLQYCWGSSTNISRFRCFWVIEDCNVALVPTTVVFATLGTVWAWPHVWYFGIS